MSQSNIFSGVVFTICIGLSIQTLGYRFEGQNVLSRNRIIPQLPITSRTCPSCHVAASTPTQPSSQNAIENEYDFIIVGGGTAGCAVARRLAEGGQHSVLVLEYGDYPNPWLDIPALLIDNVNDENRKFYRTVTQGNAGLANNGTLNYVTARHLGGGSGLNGMNFLRGSPHNYNEFARMTGDSSWNYGNLLKYFRRIEDYQGDFPSNTQHGTGGPITVSRPRYAPGLEQWLEAGRQLGYTSAVDPNGPQQVGFAPIEYSKNFGRRVSSYTGYLRPFLLSRIFHRLRVVVKAEVSRIIFEGNHAAGVIYRDRDGGNQNFFARANNEVIVSAGVINSPVILQRSGIGPQGVLQSAGIKMLKSLPVGRNLHDHMAIRLDMVIGNRSATMIPARDLTPENFRLYNETGDGPYAVFPGTPGQAFLTSTLTPRSDWSDFQIALAVSASGQSTFPGALQQTQLAPWEALINVFVLMNAPRSRGYINLNASDPDHGDPFINFGYLSNRDDLQILKEGIKKAISIFEQAPVYKKMGARYPPISLPACAHLKFRSDPYWECVIRQVASSASHGAGSCRMGKESGDPGAVVNPQLKVIGVENLRVVDASVIPKVTNSNIQAVVYVVAEKAADMILSAWK